jgi:hypothetical protein
LPRKKLPRRPEKPALNKYADADAMAQQPSDDDEDYELVEDKERYQQPSDDDEDYELVEDKERYLEDSSSSEERNVEESRIELLETDELLSIKENAPAISEDSTNPCVKEVRHLKRRVQSIQETMSLSHSISDPKIYQDNVLNAVANCVKEWRSIATHYTAAPANLEEQAGCADEFCMTEELKKPAALVVYEMIQHAIQCGPLSGSKPGYFKRCGGEVARLVVTFLDQVVPNSPVLIACMGFTSRQMDAMEMWKKNAQKASLENKPPSRAALKHQQGKGTGKKAKKKMNG